MPGKNMASVITEGEKAFKEGVRLKSISNPNNKGYITGCLLFGDHSKNPLKVLNRDDAYIILEHRPNDEHIEIQARDIMLALANDNSYNRICYCYIYVYYNPCEGCYKALKQIKKLDYWADVDCKLSFFDFYINDENHKDRWPHIDMLHASLLDLEDHGWKVRKWSKDKNQILYKYKQEQRINDPPRVTLEGGKTIAHIPDCRWPGSKEASAKLAASKGLQSGANVTNAVQSGANVTNAVQSGANVTNAITPPQQTLVLASMNPMNPETRVHFRDSDEEGATNPAVKKAKTPTKPPHGGNGS
jgi:hypothetical protein